MAGLRKSEDSIDLLASDPTTLIEELNTVKIRILTDMGSAPILVSMRFFPLTALLFQLYFIGVRLNSVFPPLILKYQKHISRFVIRVPYHAHFSKA